MLNGADLDQWPDLDYQFLSGLVPPQQSLAHGVDLVVVSTVRELHAFFAEAFVNAFILHSPDDNPTTGSRAGRKPFRHNLAAR
jgi:hypothetical protein